MLVLKEEDLGFLRIPESTLAEMWVLFLDFNGDKELNEFNEASLGVCRDFMRLQKLLLNWDSG